MNNELEIKNSWWKRNWKWSLPIFLLLSIFIFVIIINSILNGNVSSLAQAYSDNSLYENAIELSKTNQRVIEVLGDIEPIDNLAILEGNAVYSNNNNSVELSVRIKGNKGNGKMDIFADKDGTRWNYKKINIRIKEPKEEIQIIKDTVLK